MSETEMPMNAEPLKSKLDAPGVQLKAQREALGWSIEHVAEQIKLAPRQVAAIEQGDTAALPNMAVVRGFIRAYAKVVKLDAAPLVAMIEVHSLANHDAQEQAPRREGGTTFAEVRFPSMTQRALISRSRFIIVVLLLLFLLLGAYQMGAFASLIAMTQTSTSPAARAEVKAGNALPPTQSKSVPLISIPVEAGTAPRATELPVAGVPVRVGAAPVSAPAAAGSAVAPASAPVSAPAAAGNAVAPASAPVSAAAAAPAPAAAQSSNALVLTVTEDSWIELRSSGIAPQISRIVRAGNTETFNITRAVTLVVGNVGGVSATLRGAPLVLTSAAGSTISRLALE